MMYRLVICDDETRRAEQWAADLTVMDAVKAAFDIEVLDPETFAQAVNALLARQETLRLVQEEESGTTHFEGFDDAASVFDRADLLVFDMDLTPLPSALSDLGQEQADSVRSTLRGMSGETLAYFARCYSTAGYIVVVNQEYQTPTFDLTLEKFEDSYADLNVTGVDLTQPSLWTGAPGDSYRPWHWPRLVDAPEVFKSRIHLAELNTPILSAMGLAPGTPDVLTAKQVDLFGDADEELDRVTFHSLVMNPKVGLELKHARPGVEQQRRIAAGAFGRWLDRVLLPAQNLLADAPHLAQRYPGILGDSVEDPSAWQALCDLGSDLSHLKPAPLVAPWADRPIWDLREVRKAAPTVAPGVNVPELVFAEDVSRFVPVADAREFESNVAGPYDQRFLAVVPKVGYKPRQRLLRQLA